MILQIRYHYYATHLNPEASEIKPLPPVLQLGSSELGFESRSF